MKKHKQFALLEDGSIEPLYYSNGEPRWIEGGHLTLDRIKFNGERNYCIMTMCLKIIKEADSKKELKEFKKEKSNGNQGN